jgi:hypothetical protein
MRTNNSPSLIASPISRENVPGERIEKPKRCSESASSTPVRAKEVVASCGTTTPKKGRIPSVVDPTSKSCRIPNAIQFAWLRSPSSLLSR